jgi:hypothetical protein
MRGRRSEGDTFQWLTWVLIWGSAIPGLIRKRTEESKYCLPSSVHSEGGESSFVFRDQLKGMRPSNGTAQNSAALIRNFTHRHAAAIRLVRGGGGDDDEKESK